MEQLQNIAGYILDSFIQIWPYLIITIPLAVAVQISGAAKWINKAFVKNHHISIILATVIGAFSPFCSCGVIPVIASLLIGGVPLAPVMSFWIASPSMDPEIFFLSTATIGWELSVWRLAATFIISLASGYITHFAYYYGILDKEILRENQVLLVNKSMKHLGLEIVNLYRRFLSMMNSSAKVKVQMVATSNTKDLKNINCCISVDERTLQKSNQTGSKKDDDCNEGCNTTTISFHKRLLTETWKATAMVAKFMGLAFFINALIQFYIPQDLISHLLGGKGSFSVVIAALIGVPVYTTNISALPLISGLLTLGMNPGAALAFLISGPTTTLPAMIAVWGIVKKRIFLLYISFALTGAILFGLLYNVLN